MVCAVCLSEWCYAKMKVYTIDSRSESLQQILHDISLDDAKRLREKGWRYPEQVLHNWEEAKGIIEILFHDRIHRRLELVSLLHMGTANARLLENAERQQISCIETLEMDVRELPERQDPFDRILLDSPCTGLGVLRRNPDIKWKVRPKDFYRLHLLRARCWPR